MENKNHLEELAYIRSMMEQSSRFISLSGLSGIAAGTVALLGAALVFLYTEVMPFSQRKYYFEGVVREKWGMDYMTFFLLDGIIVLGLALSLGYYFSKRKARKAGQKMWTPSSIRLLVNFLIPLVTGGIFCLILMKKGYFGFVAPATLIFYGLALVNGSKYTLEDIKYLGIAEIILGLLGMWYVGFGLLLWAIGFGILHIIYGIRMYLKYDR